MTNSGDAADVVEIEWQALLASDRVNQDLIQAAYARPELRQLFPWVGMWELHFSRCTEQRWTWDIPYIAPATEGRWAVRGPSRSQFVGSAETIDDALTLVLERLPAHCGPAFLGTPQELAAHEERQEGNARR